jgi:hypothetical protein
VSVQLLDRQFGHGNIVVTYADGAGPPPIPQFPPGIRNVLNPSFRIAFPLVLKAYMIKTRNLPPLWAKSDARPNIASEDT